MKHEIVTYQVCRFIQGFRWKVGETFTSEQYTDKRMLKYYLRSGEIKEVKEVSKEPAPARGNNRRASAINDDTVADEA